MSWWALRGNPEWDVYFWSVRPTRDAALAAGNKEHDPQTDMIVELDISDKVGARIMEINEAREAEKRTAMESHAERTHASRLQLEADSSAANQKWNAARHAFGKIPVK